MGGGDGKGHCPEAKGTGFRVHINLGMNSSLPRISWRLWANTYSLSASVLIIKAKTVISELSPKL